ncbi:putative RNA-directed DNA polymerase, eukaryota, reverse transcriptase zinc-binding domain protein [Tanacetum coccineum]|uniref:RNA-directed DNA polymerase, eukaryota, reverse transcriptase zinc-binding domain protein n=1 Tax=Tanacetum coccineum TaxID=301880 RepID=A0ABQ5CRT7_9ASTR
MQNRLAWIAIEGLPPQAWHEAAFTRIASTWGEVKFPETCDTKNINLVAGKVCIRTRCMELIQHNLPVTIEGIHVCVRICKLVGECHEIWVPDKLVAKDVDDNSTNKNDTDDEEDLYDDGSDCDFFDEDYQNDVDYPLGGGWIREDQDATKKFNDDSDETSHCADNHQNHNSRCLKGTKYSNFLVNLQSQTPTSMSPQNRKVNSSISPCFVNDTYSGEMSPSHQHTFLNKVLVDVNPTNLASTHVDKAQGFVLPASHANGMSSGIFAIWNNSLFKKNKAIVDEDGFIAIYGDWVNIKKPCLMIVVYAPQDLGGKCRLWNQLHLLISNFGDLTIILGEFNEYLRQKAKIKWEIEGDENSQFFHGLVNNKFSKSQINGIFIKGVWVSDPPLVISHIFNYHKSKFEDTSVNRPRFRSNQFKTLSLHEISFLDATITSKEIKDAVWDCGGSKAPGPDGFTFKFIKHYWETIGENFVDMVKKFELDGFIPRGCNSSFITLVPKIQDLLHISDFRPISLIGCQYKVIAKILANRLQRVVYLVVSEVQTAYIKDRQIIDGPLMINGCLKSAYGSVIVNGSPTKEFKIQKGLRQGDPLSPFLFIIAVEALHIALEEAKSKHIFEGVKVSSNKVDISHLQFADDALILGKWSIDNAKNLCRILRCFNLAFGLKVNFSKSKLFGVGVSTSKTNNLAYFLNCQPSKLPCSYLGLPIGANMNMASNWNPIIEKFHKRLTSWKAKTLSYGGRLTLLKSVLGALGGSLESNKMAWIAWDKTCSSPSCGGLGIGSLDASNLAMLVKWWWPFLTEDNSLWKLIITSIHGPDGGVSGFDSLGSSSFSMLLSPWSKIMNLNKHLVCADINLQSIFSRKVGNGASFSFWNDAWLGEQCLKNTFPRLYALEQSKECKVVDRCNMLYGSKSRSWDWRRELRDGHEKDQLDGLLYLLRDFDPSDVEDSWACSLNSNNTYTVSSMRKMIEGNLLPF